LWQQSLKPKSPINKNGILETTLAKLGIPRNCRLSANREGSWPIGFMAKTAKSDVSARKKSGIIRPFCTAGPISQSFTIFKPEHVADKQRDRGGASIAVDYSDGEVRSNIVDIMLHNIVGHSPREASIFPNSLL
jgi:hypothetical protein